MVRWWLVMAAGVLGWTGGARGQEGSLVANGGFEDGVAGWHLVLGGYGQQPARLGRDAVRARIVAKGAHTGHHALVLDAVGLSHEVDAYSVPIPVQPAYAYRLQSFVRQTAGTAGYKVTLDWQTPGGEHVAYANDWQGANRPRTYQPHGGIFVAPANAGRVVLILGVQKGTRCLFDNLTLLELGATEPLGARRRRDGDGQISIEGPEKVDAQGHATWRAAYICGESGLPAGGSIVLRRWPVSFDWSPPQGRKPKGAGFVSANGPEGAILEVSAGSVQEVVVKVGWPSLQPGERVEIVVGDRSHGGPGMRVQGKLASDARWIAASDCTADGEYRDLPATPGCQFRIVPGPAVSAWVVAPSAAEVGRPAALRVEVRDAAGNVTDRFGGRCVVSCTPPEAGFPRGVGFTPGVPASRRLQVLWQKPGLHTLTAALPRAGRPRGRPARPAGVTMRPAWTFVSSPWPAPPAAGAPDARAAVNARGAVLANDCLALVFARNPGSAAWGCARLMVREGSDWRAVAVLPAVGRAAFRGAAPGPVPGDLFFATDAQARQSGSQAALVLRGRLPASASPPSPSSAGLGGPATWPFTATYRLTPGARSIAVRLAVQPAGRDRLVALHAPLLYPGDGTSGEAKAGALFPGVEFLTAEEHSSDDVGVAWGIRERWVPHPYKITVPLMAVAAAKHVVGMAWEPAPPTPPNSGGLSRSAPPTPPNSGGLSRSAPPTPPNSGGLGGAGRLAPPPHAGAVRVTPSPVAIATKERPQPCLRRYGHPFTRSPAAHFASPNRREGKPNHLMALVLPGLTKGFRENVAGLPSGWTPPAGGPLSVSAELFALPGTDDVVDAVRWWAQTHRLPAAQPPRSRQEALALSARGLLETAYDPQAKGWITAVGWKPGFHPEIADRLVQAAYLSGDKMLAGRADAQVDESLRAIGGPRGALLHLSRGDAEAAVAELRGAAYAAMGKQHADGSWSYADVYSTEGNKATLAQPDDVELGTCVNPLDGILAYACATGDPEAIASGLRGLEYLRRFAKPAGSESWEVPLPCPNLRAAALACRCYLRGWQLTGREEYLHLARRWAWAGLSFIYLWQAPDRPAMPGASISVMGTTFYGHPWFGAAVQWVGLAYAEVLQELAPLDDAYDWRRVAELITASALHQQKTGGAACKHAGFFPDSYSLVKGADYYEWCLAPTGIASNLLGLMGHSPGLTALPLAAGKHRVHVLGVAPVTRWLWNEAAGEARLTLRRPPSNHTQVVIYGLAPPTEAAWAGQPLLERGRLDSRWHDWFPALTESALVFRLVWRAEEGELVLKGVRPSAYAPPKLPDAVVNGGFEEGARGWACDPEARLDAQQPHAGKAALVVTASDPAREGQAFSSVFRVEPGRRYRLRAWVRQAEGDGQYKVTIEWLAPGGAHLSYDNDWAGTDRPRAYREHGGVFTAPATAAGARIILGCRGARCLFDDVSLKPTE